MSDLSIRAKLGVDVTDWRSDLRSAVADAKKFQAAAKETQAIVTSLDRTMRAAGGGTEAQKVQLKAAKDALAEYRSELKKAERAVKDFNAVQVETVKPRLQAMPEASRPQATIRRASVKELPTSGSGGGSKVPGGLGQQLAYQASDVATQVAGGTDVGQALFQQGMQILPMVGGGLALGAASAAALVVALEEGRKKAQAMREETKLLAGTLGNEAVASVETLNAKFDEAAANAKKVSEARGSYFNALVNTYTGQGVQESDMVDARNLLRLAETKRNSAQGRDIDLRDREAKGEDTTRLRIGMDYQSKRGEISDGVGRGEIQDGPAALELAKKDYEQRLAAYEKMSAAQKAEYALEMQLNNIRRDGRNILSESARARLDVAKAEAARITVEGPAKDKASAKVVGLETEYAEAQRKEQADAAGQAASRANAADDAAGKGTALKQAQNALTEAINKRESLKGLNADSPEVKAADEAIVRANTAVGNLKQQEAVQKSQRSEAARLAGLTGPQADRQRETLLSARGALQRQLDPTSAEYQPDEEKRKEINARLVENGASVRVLDRADKQREFRRREEEIDANEGRGPMAQAKSIEARQQLVRDRQGDNAGNEKDVDVASALNREAAALLRRKTDILYAEQRSLTAARAQTREMQLRASGRNEEAAILAVQTDYEAQIEDALRNGNKALAEELRTREQIALVPLQAAANTVTPAQLAERRAEIQNMQNAADSRPHTRSADSEGSHYNDAGWDGKNSNIPTAGSGPFSAYDAPENNTGGSFDAFLADSKRRVASMNPATMPSLLPPVMPAPEIQVPNFDYGEGAVSGVLEGFTEAIKDQNALLKEIMTF